MSTGMIRRSPTIRCTMVLSCHSDAAPDNLPPAAGTTRRGGVRGAVPKTTVASRPESVPAGTGCWSIANNNSTPALSCRSRQARAQPSAGAAALGTTSPAGAGHRYDQKSSPDIARMISVGRARCSGHRQRGRVEQAPASRLIQHWARTAPASSCNASVQPLRAGLIYVNTTVNPAGLNNVICVPGQIILSVVSPVFAGHHVSMSANKSSTPIRG